MSRKQACTAAVRARAWGLETLGHGLVLGLAEGVLVSFQLGAVGRQVVQVEVLFQQIRSGLPHLLPTVDRGVVQDHHAREAAVRRQGVPQGRRPRPRPSRGGRSPTRSGVAATPRFRFSVSGAVRAAMTFTRCPWGLSWGTSGRCPRRHQVWVGGRQGLKPVSSRKKKVQLSVTGFF